VSKSEECFLVMGLEEEIETTDGDEMDLVWAEGMIGAMPLFDTKKHALDYCKDESMVIRMIMVSGDSEEWKGENYVTRRKDSKD